MIRLNKFIAKSGFCSRRKADILIENGKVKVNGKIITQPYFRIKDNDVVEVEGRPIKPREFIYLIFNKPAGVVTTLSDRYAKRKIIDYFPSEFKGIFPVGRLDKDSEGLIILTNDGELCYRLTHPKFMIEKEYIVWVEGYFQEKFIKVAKKGVRFLKDVLKVKEIFIEKRTYSKTKLKVIVCEGKKRHLRRLFLALGFKVIRLKRVRIGRLRLGNLKKGAYRILDKEKIYELTLGEI